MTRQHYATAAQAHLDAASLEIDQLELTPSMLLTRHVASVVCDPRSNSDTLLIVADALREAASIYAGTPPGRNMAILATRLAALAPLRANPITEPPC